MTPFFKRFLPVILTTLAVIISGLALPAGLTPVSYAQDGDGYNYTIVGGVDEPQAYADQTVEGFEFTDFTYRSLYPSGMEFVVTITPPEDVTINSVTLFYTFSTGKPGRVNAEPGDEPGQWIATPYRARGLPPWHEVDAYWGVRMADGASVDSEPVHAVYYDPTREWYRAENEDVIVYWYDMPEELGQYVLEAMAGNRDRYLAGFGILLPYRPMAVIFPPGSAWNEYKGNETVDDTDFGSTGTIISEAGSTIQRVRTLAPAKLREDCIWNPKNPTAEFQMQQAASTTTHEVAHLYQQELGVAGPLWWVEGQAMFFETFEEYPVHERLSTLAQMQDGYLPTFQGDGPSGGAFTAEADGCTHLIYDMGSSFMTWLVESHGGMDTYRAIVQEMARARPMKEAIETVTGYTLLELENEWRVFLGVPELTPEQVDPSLALAEPAEPYFEVGEEVIMPGMPFQQSIYNQPSTTSISDAVCFANTPITILRTGNDGQTNWYEVDCMGMVGWMNQGQLVVQ
jgi:hypothetical protein